MEQRVSGGLTMDENYKKNPYYTNEDISNIEVYYKIDNI